MMRVLFFLIATSPAFACSVPVFRYALEHWPADAYRVTLPMGAALGGNFQITNGSANRIELRQPRMTGNDELVWSADYSMENVRRLVDSPARREIIKRLSDGESAVWVLLESGNAKKDAEAAEFLAERLGFLAGVMKLPVLDEQDLKNGLVSVSGDDLRLAFSMMKVKRDDPEEDAFAAMLLASEEGLREFDEPMVFPIFGQGRVLYALVGKGIRAETVDSAAAFLVGSCSCQVKEQNPGVDLVMAADWKQVAKHGKELVPVEKSNEAQPQTVRIEAPRSEDAPEKDAKIAIPVVAVAILALIAGRAWLRRA